jgi:glycosyltransferase involved in cell wall biosynthesis
MKILQIAPPWIATPPTGYGGTELVIYNLCEQMVTMGHEVTLFATKNSKTSAKLKYVFDKGLYEQGLPWNGALPSILHYQQACKLFSEGDYDIAHLHLSSQTDLMLLAFLSELKKPYVLTIHGHLPFDRYTNFDEFYFDTYASKVSAVNISQTMHDYMPKQFKSDGFVYNGMEVEKMTYNPNPGKYFAWIGRIVPVKGLHHAINVALKTGEKLFFAGTVDLQNTDGGLDYFNNLIKPHIDGEQIKFLGEADFEIKNQLFSNAKAFLNPIDWVEPFGMVMIEAMGCGTPVISFDKGAAKELVLNEETGFLVRDEDEMIEAMSKIHLIDRAVCRNHVLQNFTARASAEGYLKIYHQKVKQHVPTTSRVFTETKHLFGDFVKIRPKPRGLLNTKTQPFQQT